MSIEELKERARRVFNERFGKDPNVIARAPGRVELLGNHTDYNGGLVLAAAIDRFAVVAGRATTSPGASVHSANFDQTDTFHFGRDQLELGDRTSWARYVRGVVWALTERQRPTGGFEAVIAGNVPLGAGLSSSASLQAAIGTFLLSIGFVEGPKGESEDSRLMSLAQTLQRGENEFVGVASGLLDQFTVLFGRAGHAVGLDCRDLSHRRLPFGPNPPAIVVCDSMTSRSLADGKYNERRAECERVVAHFQELQGGEAVRWLRDVTRNQLESAWDDLDPVGRLRARHVLAENERVRQGASALLAGDVPTFGRLMSASHASSRDDFGNSSPALDDLIEAAEDSPGFLGGKLSGGGWAGCTVNLVAADQAEAFAESVAEGYARRTGRRPDVHVCNAVDGASASVQ
ncbi:MAG: galactokinase [Isosphaeraceae bacterium]